MLLLLYIAAANPCFRQVATAQDEAQQQPTMITRLTLRYSCEKYVRQARFIRDSDCLPQTYPKAVPYYWDSMRSILVFLLEHSGSRG